jgi:hypothetical protein
VPFAAGNLVPGMWDLPVKLDIGHLVSSVHKLESMDAVAVYYLITDWSSEPRVPMRERVRRSEHVAEVQRHWTTWTGKLRALVVPNGSATVSREIVAKYRAREA